MVEIEYITLLVNSILIPICIFGYRKINNWSSDICNRLTKIEHKLELDHG